MLADVVDRGFVNRQPGEIRRRLQAGTLRRAPAREGAGAEETIA